MSVRLLFLGLVIAMVLAHESAAAAQTQVHGAVDGRLLVGVTNRFGGSLGADLWLGAKALRVGGMFAVGALSKGGGASSRVFTPFGLSLGIMPREDRTGPTALLRGGLYAGAQKGGLIMGPWVGSALGYRVALGEGASVRFGADAWALFRYRGGLFLGPYIGLGF